MSSLLVPQISPRRGRITQYFSPHRVPGRTGLSPHTDESTACGQSIDFYETLSHEPHHSVVRSIQDGKWKYILCAGTVSYFLCICLPPALIHYEELLTRVGAEVQILMTPVKLKLDFKAWASQTFVVSYPSHPGLCHSQEQLTLGEKNS